MGFKRISILVVAIYFLLVTNEWSAVNGLPGNPVRQRRSGVSDQLMAHYGARQLVPIVHYNAPTGKINYVQLWKEFKDRKNGGSIENIYDSADDNRYHDFLA